MSSRGLLVALAAALALAVGLGFWLGRSDLGSTAPSSGPGESGPLVAAGAIGHARGSAVTGWDFALPVFNGSAATVHIAVAGLAGLVAPVRAEPDVEVGPGAWGSARFAVSTSCDTPSPGVIPSVRLRITTGGSTATATLPIESEGQLLVDYLRAVCGAGDLVRPGDLVGSWIVEQAFGPERYVAGAQLMRFTRGGAYVTELQDRLLGSGSAVRGRYRLRGEVMVVTTENGSGCGAGARATWRTTLDSDDRLTMVYLGGDCPEGEEGNVWVSRRLLRDEDLPPVG